MKVTTGNEVFGQADDAWERYYLLIQELRRGNLISNRVPGRWSGRHHPRNRTRRPAARMLMWNFGQLRSQRSAESRRRLTNGQSPWQQRARTWLRWPLVIATGFWACATLIVIYGDEPLAYSTDQILKQPVLSRVDFERVNKFQTEDRRRKAQQAVPNYFWLNVPLIEAIQAGFRDLHAAVKASEDLAAYRLAHAKRWPLNESEFDVFKASADEVGSEQFRLKVDNLARWFAEEPMVEQAEVEREPRTTSSHVMLDRGDGGFRSVPKERLTYARESSDVESLADSVVIRCLFHETMRSVLRAIIIEAISPGGGRYQPVYVFDDTFTKGELQEAGNVDPVKDRYEKGDRLVKAGKITEEALVLLKTEHAEYLEQRHINPELRAQWRDKRIGLMGIILLATVGLSIFAYRCQRRVVQKAPRALALAGFLLLMLLFDRFVLPELSDSPMWVVITITMTAAILTISYSQLFALGTTAVLALISVPTIAAPYSLLIVLMSVATASVLMLREIRRRIKMVEVGVVTSAVASFSALLVGLAEGQVVGRDVAVAALAALAGTSLVLVLLPVIEKVFRITTSMTLLEWADTSRPMLRQLIEKAPGTWQHSHLLGSMAEAAAEEINANGLLARVGAYYHDIGKTCKPNYFIENQEAKMNAHQGLAPTMSMLVILAHVKDGLSLAKEHRLPPALHQFIAEHHGTTVVKYFHAMAEQEARTEGRNSREVSDTEFRYPGPKPRSKETAILMLCDGAEGAVRSLQDPTPGRIENKVHEILMARLMDGQFDECDITLRELARVEQSLVKSLRAIHHGRIAYPKSAESTEAQVRSA